MAFSKPTLAELVTRIETDISTRMGSTSKPLRVSFSRVLARALAGAAWLLHGNIEWVTKQVFPSTAEKEYLDIWAALWGVVRQTPTYTKRTLTFTGTNGSVVPIGTEVQTTDGLSFLTEAAVTIATGTGNTLAQAKVPGSASNLAVGAALSLISPVVGVNSLVTVASAGLIDGTDEETDTALRTRLTARIQSPPRAGTPDDYVNWALEVAGVTRAWCFPLHMGAGTVGVTFVRDLDPSIIPDAAELAQVDTYLKSKKPITADLYVFAPVVTTIPVTIDLAPDTPEIRASVQSELASFFADLDIGAVVYRSQISERISAAAGEVSHVLVAPVGDTTLAANSIAQLGTITWQ